jgi:deferrochelatase/peroxidase EfeB
LLAGAPVQVFPTDDNPNEAEKNDFDYTRDLQDKNCPFAAHIRKTKPRGDIGNLTDFDIMRRGIPYGKEFSGGEKKTTEDRGLLFVCYQSSLAKGFQFITESKLLPAIPQTGISDRLTHSVCPFSRLDQ